MRQEIEQGQLTAILRKQSILLWGAERTSEIDSSIRKAAAHLHVLAQHPLDADGDEPFEPPSAPVVYGP